MAVVLGASSHSAQSYLTTAYTAYTAPTPTLTTYTATTTPTHSLPYTLDPSAVISSLAPPPTPSDKKNLFVPSSLAATLTTLLTSSLAMASSESFGHAVSVPVLLAVSLPPLSLSHPDQDIADTSSALSASISASLASSPQLPAHVTWVLLPHQGSSLPPPRVLRILRSAAQASSSWFPSSVQCAPDAASLQAILAQILDPYTPSLALGSDPRLALPLRLLPDPKITSPDSAASLPDSLSIVSYTQRSAIFAIPCTTTHTIRPDHDSQEGKALFAMLATALSSSKAALCTSSSSSPTICAALWIGPNNIIKLGFYAPSHSPPHPSSHPTTHSPSIKPGWKSKSVATPHGWRRLLQRIRHSAQAPTATPESITARITASLRLAARQNNPYFSSLLREALFPLFDTIPTPISDAIKAALQPTSSSSTSSSSS